MAQRRTIHERDVEKMSLPKRDIRLLVGPGVLGSKNLNFGVTEVPPCTAMDFHTHQDAEEIIYILTGWGEAVVDDQAEEIEPGSAIYLPCGASHSINNKSPQTMRFTFCFSPPFPVGAAKN